MLKTSNRCTDAEIANLAWYGNWCGLGGAGATIDKKDKCCKAHDQCYDDSSCLLHGSLVLYEWNGGICAGISCLDDTTSCAHEACDCDRTFANCIDRAVASGDGC